MPGNDWFLLRAEANHKQASAIAANHKLASATGSNQSEGAPRYFCAAWTRRFLSAQSTQCTSQTREPSAAGRRVKGGRGDGEIEEVSSMRQMRHNSHPQLSPACLSTACIHPINAASYPGAQSSGVGLVLAVLRGGIAGQPLRQVDPSHVFVAE